MNFYEAQDMAFAGDEIWTFAKGYKICAAGAIELFIRWGEFDREYANKAVRLGCMIAERGDCKTCTNEHCPLSKTWGKEWRETRSLQP